MIATGVVARPCRYRIRLMVCSNPSPGRFKGISRDSREIPFCSIPFRFLHMYSDSLLSTLLSLPQWVSQVQKRSCCVCMNYQSIEWSEASPVCTRILLSPRQGFESLLPLPLSQERGYI